MADQLQPSEIIKNNPIGKCLDNFRDLFKSICENRGIITCNGDALDQLGNEDIQTLTLLLLPSLRSLLAAEQLPSKTGRNSTLKSDILRLISAAASVDFDFDRVKPLLNAALPDDKPDSEIWDQVYTAVTEFTPPPRPLARSSLFQQTPWIRNASSFVNSSEHRKYMDSVLKEELGFIYVGLPYFDETYFGGVADLETASKTFFKQCTEGSDPLFDNNGWRGWPDDAEQDKVLSWFTGFCEKLAAFAEGYKSPMSPTHQRRVLALPNNWIDGSVAKRKMDVGFVINPETRPDSRFHWSGVLIAGELKSNPSADRPLEAWLDLGRYVREVFSAQDTRRFVLGFTICGSLMRIWEFDRLGGIASGQFDINKDGLRFISTILGFLWMNNEQLGFDPTIITGSGGERYIEIQRNGLRERLIIDEVMRRAPCVAGRATTCWKAHREGDTRTPLVIKDSWQFTERDEEGELLREAAKGGVVNLARYYHHETVKVGNTDDDIQSNIRRDLDITTAENYRVSRTSTAGTSTGITPRQGRSAAAGSKRSSSQIAAFLPPSKRSHSSSLKKPNRNSIPNRVHRRLVVRDFGEPIYKASSRVALLRGLEACIEGHESLYKCGLLHRDISMNNLMINEDDENPSWPAFLIDLDLAIKEQRQGASGAKGMTGTRAFMAIGALLSEHHTYMFDLESFFWVLFWICIHFEEPAGDKERVVPKFEKWNFIEADELAASKSMVVSDDEYFLRVAEEYFTPYYQSLIPWVDRLRREVFPKGRRWRTLEPALYASMKDVLCKAREDSKVLSDT
ncbi:hypothetical protein VM1G_08192 [Cytospora mali]|uniref:non-specific serine/threonine protein kinase n=1 Tax=Cytospora mali TaxID=578113 RepID=A0A194WAF5_CYTMA|nr:hypothetical protein VM1G_08192 [Valsa mali]